MSSSPAPRYRALKPALVALMLGLALLATAVPARAAGGLKVSPSRIDVAAERGDRLPPITLANTTNRPLTLTLDHAAVGQDLSGLPVPDPAGRSFLRIAPKKIVLGAGERRVVRATVTGGPTRGIGAYGVIVVTTEPTRRAGSATIANRLRLSGTVLLRFPGRAAVRGRVSAVRLAQGAPRVLKLFARVHNSGNLHAKPRARLTIRDAAGKLVHAARMPAGNVIPDADRELVGEIRRILPAGTYTARVAVRMGRVRSSRSTRFTLVGPNRLPTSRLRIVGLTTPSPQAGDRVEATVTVRNTGTAAVTPTGLATLAPAGGGAITARTPVSIGTLEPGATRERRLSLPPIRSGDHELTVKFLDGDRVIAERTATFALAGSRPLTARILDWIAAHLPLVLGSLAILIVLFVAAVLARLRQLKRRLLADAAAARVTAQHKPMTDRAHRPDAEAAQPQTPTTADAPGGPVAAVEQLQPAVPARKPAFDAAQAVGIAPEQRRRSEPAETAEPTGWQASVAPPSAAESDPVVVRRRSGGLLGKVRKPR